MPNGWLWSLSNEHKESQTSRQNTSLLPLSVSGTSTLRHKTCYVWSQSVGSLCLPGYCKFLSLLWAYNHLWQQDICNARLLFNPTTKHQIQADCSSCDWSNASTSLSSTWVNLLEDRSPLRIWFTWQQVQESCHVWTPHKDSTGNVPKSAACSKTIIFHHQFLAAV